MEEKGNALASRGIKSTGQAEMPTNICNLNCCVLAGRLGGGDLFRYRKRLLHSGSYGLVTWHGEAGHIWHSMGGDVEYLGCGNELHNCFGHVNAVKFWVIEFA